MKYIVSQLVFMAGKKGNKRNLGLLIRFLAVLAVMIAVYSVIFHYIMEWEGKKFSWITGLYWTLTVMSTLGFGDITFDSDLGKIFSMLVLMSGIVFLLVLLPFTFIQFFYAPWIEAQTAAQTPRFVASGTTNHVILVNYDPVTSSLIQKLTHFGHEHVVILADLDEAISLTDQGIRVVVGEIDDPDTYRRARAEHAAFIATTHDDFLATSVVFTARSVAPGVPIVATCNERASVDILRRAGASHVLRLGEMMGKALARCTVGGDAVTHVIGQVDELLIAESNTTRTPLVGKSLSESKLSDLGINVVGIWDRGCFSYATADSIIGDHSILVLAGSAEQFRGYDERYIIYNKSNKNVVIIGGGRVGRAASRALTNRNINSCIVELLPDRVPPELNSIIGNAAELDVLTEAGLLNASTVLITTHDDHLNVYLTIYCRSLRKDVQIISRASLDRNTEMLHRAGADFVFSYASMGATNMLNQLKETQIVTITEGLDVFRTTTPASLDKKSIASSGVREKTGCTIVAVRVDEKLQINPTADTVLVAGQEIVLVGDSLAEEKYFNKFCRS